MTRFEYVALAATLGAWAAFGAYLLYFQPPWLARVFVPAIF